MIQISDIAFRYPSGGFCLQIDALSIEPGSSTAVIGRSGTGKTTLLKLISGVSIPTGGKIVTNGTEVSTLDDRKRRDFRIRSIGMIFQEFELLDYLSVLDNILLPYRISSALRLDATVRTQAAELAEQVGIADKLKRRPRELSQGERQRVAICRALLPDPPLLLADEPTGNLDPENTDRILNIVFDYVHRRGGTLISVTHERYGLDRFDAVIDFDRFRKEENHA
jgi:ABC-type lipoprotein export system ATPase subunit